MERADDGFHQRVEQAFAEFSTREWQAAHPEAGPIVSVDARGTVDEVFARVTDTLASRWPEYSSL